VSCCVLQCVADVVEWCSPTNLIFAVHFLQKRPTISGCIAERDLQIKESFGDFATLYLLFFKLTRHFIKFVVAETKEFVGSNANVILTRHTCGQRSRRAAGSKRRVLGNYFSMRICYEFLISKCRGKPDLGLCTTSVLAKRMLLRIRKS